MLRVAASRLLGSFSRRPGQRGIAHGIIHYRPAKNNVSPGELMTAFVFLNLCLWVPALGLSKLSRKYRPE